jgi:hypothetical protein
MPINRLQPPRHHRREQRKRQSENRMAKPDQFEQMADSFEHSFIFM